MKRPLFLIVLRHPFKRNKKARWMLYVSFVLIALWGGTMVATLKAAGGKGATLEKALYASGFMAHADLRRPTPMSWVTHQSQYGFSIALPEGWIFKDVMGEEKNGIEVDWTSVAHDPKGKVTLLVQRLKTDDLKGWIDQGILLSPGIEGVQFEPYAEGKKKGYRLRYRQKDPEGVDREAREMYVDLNKHTYVRLAMFAPVGTLQEDLFSDIVNRLRIQKNQSMKSMKR